MSQKINRIVSFGDSFIYGNELAADQGLGADTWPALIAGRLGLDYQTTAVPGCGNEDIARQVREYFAHHSAQGVLAVINWTWSLRWDIHLAYSQSWITLGPTCVPRRLEQHLPLPECQRLIDFYQDYGGRSSTWNHWRSLQAIWSTQCYLDHLSVVTVETAMDRELFSHNDIDRLERYQAIRDPSWPNITSAHQLDNLPAHIRQELDDGESASALQKLRNQISHRIQWFDGQGFLEWSQHHGFAVTELLHPLDQAHEAAADYWIDHYRALIA